MEKSIKTLFNAFLFYSLFLTSGVNARSHVSKKNLLSDIVIYAYSNYLSKREIFLQEHGGRTKADFYFVENILGWPTYDKKKTSILKLKMQKIRDMCKRVRRVIN